MKSLSVREWAAVVAGTVVFFAGAVVAGVLYALDALPTWAGWVLAVTAIAGLVLLVGTTVRALLRGDTEGVERQDAARASIVTVLVVVVAGFAYSLLEAFAGVVWMIAFAWGRWGSEEG